MQVLTAGALYFALVFAAGFVLGPIRVLWAEPRFGPRVAELMEAPLMLVVIVVAARAVLRRLAVPPAPGPRLGMAGAALALLLGAELTVVLRLRFALFSLCAGAECAMNQSAIRRNDGWKTGLSS